MRQKRGPYIFLIILIIVLVFILGIRYGQSVEKTNKVIDYFLSLPPTKPQTTPAPLRFETYTNKVCGIKFLYPSFLKKEEDSSDSARFAEKNITVLVLSCKEKNEVLSLLEDKNIASQEITLKEKKVTAKLNKNNFIFEFKNPKNHKTLYLLINQNLFPLFESSLQYLDL